MPVSAPFAIVLNGTSSAGKSTLARALQHERPEVWVHLPVDAFLSMLPIEERPADVSGEFSTIARGIHDAMGAMARSGNRVIIDHVLEVPRWGAELRQALADVPQLWVGVRCALDELDRREAARGDREIGQARSQLHVHDGVDYDIEIETSALDPVGCAAVVSQRLDLAG